MAKRLDADFLVSLHINSDPSPSRTGALLLSAYNSGYRTSVGIKTTKLGKKILDNLQLAGVYNGGFLLRKSMIIIIQTKLEQITIQLYEKAFITRYLVLLLNMIYYQQK